VTILIRSAQLLTSDYLAKQTLITRFDGRRCVASGTHCVKVVEDVVVKKLTFAISSPDEFLVVLTHMTA